MAKRVVAIGLDAANWDYLSELMDAGDCPNLKAMLGESLHARLTNVEAYRSEMSWTTFTSGQLSPSIGYWSTVSFDPETYEAKDKGASPTLPFWSSLPVERPIVFDVPHTVLGDHPNLVQVTSWGAHSAQFPRASRPAGLLSEIDERFGPHPSYEADNEVCWHHESFMRELTDGMVTGARRRAEICKWLMTQHPDWDLMMTVFSEPHSIGHHAFHGVDRDHPLYDDPKAATARSSMRRVHMTLDEVIGDLRAFVGDDVTFIVFAVHGMANNTNDVPGGALVPELLYRLQFGAPGLANPTRVHGARTDRPWSLPVGHSNRYMARLFADTPLGKVKRALWMYTPPRLDLAQKQLRARLRGRTFRDVFSLSGHGTPPEQQGTNEELLENWAGEQAFQAPKLYRRYWPQMRAFALPTYSDAHIRLNVQGRERDGIVPLADYEAVCDEIERELHALRDIADGGPVFRELIRLRSDDPMDPEGPSGDLLAVFDRPTSGCDHPTAGRLGPYPTMRTGEHDNNGFIMIAGPGIRPDELHPHDGLDVAATVASLVGADVSEGFDGTPIIPTVPA